MTDLKDTSLLDITEINPDNFHIFDGAQRIEDFDEITTSESDCDSDDDMVTLFRSYEGS